LLILLIYTTGFWLATNTLPLLVYYPAQTDFGVYYEAAGIGLRQGWASMYDPHVFLPSYAAVMGGRIMPYVNPPALAWLVLPLTLLPFRSALLVWTIAATASLLIMWRLVAPSGVWWNRVLWLLLLSSSPAVLGSLKLGQSTWIVLLSVTGCWWLLRRERPLLAGAVLAIAFVKPQLIWVVPVAFLVTGQLRAFIGWLAATGPMALVSLAALGAQGVLEFHQSIGLIYRLPDLELVTAYEAMHGGAAGWLAAAACTGLGLMAARHVRSAGPGPLMAAGLLASLLASPYANGYDLSVLILAAWLTFHDYSVTPPAALFLIAAWIALLFVHVTAWPELLAAIAGLVLMLLWDLDRASVRELESSTT
jgi:hypothetical protein